MFDILSILYNASYLDTPGELIVKFSPFDNLDIMSGLPKLTFSLINGHVIVLPLLHESKTTFKPYLSRKILFTSSLAIKSSFPPPDTQLLPQTLRWMMLLLLPAAPGRKEQPHILLQASEKRHMEGFQRPDPGQTED